MQFFGFISFPLEISLGLIAPLGGVDFDEDLCLPLAARSVLLKMISKDSTCTMQKLSGRFVLKDLGISLTFGICLVASSPFPGLAQESSSSVAPPRLGRTVAVVEPGTGGITIAEPLSATMQADGFSQFRGITSLDTAARQMTLNRNVLPPGSRGPRNMHKNSETMVMVLQGTLTVLVGRRGEKVLLVKSGEFLYVPGNVWHQWTNPGGDYVEIVEARGDANPSSNLYVLPLR